MSTLAIIAGRGVLPALVSRARPEALVTRFAGIGLDFTPDNVEDHRFERLGALFKSLRARNVKQVVFAGAMTRPDIQMSKLDMKTMTLMPRILKAMQSPDGSLMRTIRLLFEDEGFDVVGAHKIRPDILAKAGQMGRIAPAKMAMTDMERAKIVHEAMGAVDIGQALVIAKGQCLAVEALPGTQAMLDFVALHRRTGKPPEGILYKAPKTGQDLDLDMPAIGVDTIAQVKNAGLKGIVLGAGKTLLLDPDKVIQAADEAEIFLWGA